MGDVNHRRPATFVGRESSNATEASHAPVVRSADFSVVSNWVIKRQMSVKGKARWMLDTSSSFSARANCFKAQTSCQTETFSRGCALSRRLSPTRAEVLLSEDSIPRSSRS